MAKLLAYILLVFLSSPVMAAALVDPTKPSGYVGALQNTADASSELNLKSVLIGPDRKIALINDRIVRVNDEIAGLKVVDILPNGVKLEGDTERFLGLVRQNVKSVVTNGHRMHEE